MNPATTMPPAYTGFATGSEAIQATTLVERLAVFAKSAFVYPDGNHRVLASLAEAMVALRACAAGAPIVRVGVLDTGLSVDECAIAADGPLTEWFRDVMISSRLGMVAFETSVADGAVLAWIRHLQCAQANRSLTYAATWGGVVLPGITVREFMLATASPGAEDGPAATTDVPEAVAVDQLKSMLAANARVAGELRALQNLLARGGTTNAAQVTDLLDELVRNLSTEAVRDPDYAAVVAERVLSSVRRTFMQDEARPRRDDITPMLMELGRKLFPRIDVASAPTVAAPGRGHNDEHILHDPGALLAELTQAEAQTRPVARLRAAPVTTPAADLAGETSTAAEVAGIVLHTLAGSDRLPTDALRARLLKQALIAGPGVNATICAYVDRALDDDERGGKPGRLQELVHSLDARGMLQTSGFLAAEGVAADFPRRVPLLVDVCSAEQAAQVLAETARRLSPQKILAADRWFARHRTVLTGECVEKLLPLGGRSLLPMAILALRHSPNDCRGFVADYLRGLNGSAAVVAPLVVADPSTRLSVDYLARLAAFLLDGGTPPPELLAATGEALRQAAQELTAQPQKEATRVACIKAMEGFPSDALRAYLHELVGARRAVFLRRESKQVRRAARDVLRTWRKR